MTLPEKEVDPVVHSGDDEAYKTEHAEATAPVPESLMNMTEAELSDLQKKMVRKMDIVIMYAGAIKTLQTDPLRTDLSSRPIMGILYILNYVDRSALAATKVYGIMDDLNMDTQQFATAISILFGETS